MLFLSWLVQCLLILLTVAFFTLFERNVMGLFHLRMGPNNVSFIGLIQPLLDAFKLLSKQASIPLNANYFFYNISPFFSLSLSLLIWVSIPSIFNSFSVNYSFLLFYSISSCLVFCVLLAGWSSNSNYSLIGSLRAVAQSISYESVLSTLLVLFLVLFLSFSVRSSSSLSSPLFLFLLPFWLLCTLAETHRAPFDFSESESELVSGFNTEYSGSYFAFIFLSEYSILLLSSMLMVFIFFSWFLSSFLGVLFYVLITLVISYFFIWVRITFCRFRYDALMAFAWNSLLPTSLIFFSCFLSQF